MKDSQIEEDKYHMISLICGINLVPNWEKICQGCILSSFLFNLYAEYIIRNAGLKETQAGIKIGGRNSNNLRYADDTTLMAQSEELKSLLMKVKEERGKVALKLSIQETKITASSLITSCKQMGKQWKQ